MRAAAILGLSRGTTRAHIARAALESIAFQSAELLAAMQADAGSPLRELRVDGGAARNDLLLQFQADLLGVPVLRPSNIETTAQGAANLAGLAVGLWRSTSELADNWRVDRRFEPALSRQAAAEHMDRWSRAVDALAGLGTGAGVTMGRAIAIATPVFFALIGLEYAWGRLRGRNTYRLNDAVASLSLGVLSQLSNLFTQLLRVGLYAIAWAHLAIRPLPLDAWWVWVSGVVVYDFCYYWHHRLGHESAIFWAAHVVHHQSQEFNLSTALRQTSSGAFLGWLFYLPMAVAGFPPQVFAGGRADRPALPVLDTHRARRPAGADRSHPRHAVEPSRASRGQRPVRRPELRRHPDRLGPAVRQFRTRIRALRVRHTRAARFLGPDLGQRRGLRRPCTQVLARASVGRQAQGVVQATRLASARRGSGDLAAFELRSCKGAAL